MNRFHLSLRKDKTAKASQASDKADFTADKISRLLGEGATVERTWSIASTAHRRSSDETAVSSEELSGTDLSQASTLEMAPLDRLLDRKASSVLLRKDSKFGSQKSNLSKAHDLKESNSSSTLNSFYDPHSAPLQISQQTSNSSARDLALRKGMPSIKNLIKPQKRSNAAPRKLQSRRSEQALKTLKQKPAAVDITTLFPRPGVDQRPSTKGSQSTGLTPKYHSKALSGSSSTRSSSTVRIEQGTPRPSGSRDGPASKSKTYEPQDISGNPSYLKVNVRRPKAGVKEWFDELDDQSDEEVNDEPDFRQNFVEDLETAFKNGEIRPRTAPEISAANVVNYENGFEISLIQRRGNTSKWIVPARPLNIKIPPPQHDSDDQVGVPSEDRPAEEPHVNRMESANLQEQSVLYLSSSDDEEDDDELPNDVAQPSMRPGIRDSVLNDAIDEAEFEFGTAQAISTQAIASGPSAKVNRLPGVEKREETASGARNVPMRRSSRLFSYFNETPTETRTNSAMTSFPSDYSDVESDDFAAESVRSSLYANPTNTRMMPVTRQEQRLLAAMRAKRAGDRPAHSRNSFGSFSDSDASHKSFKIHHPMPRTFKAGTPVAEQLDRGLRRTSVTSGSIRFRDLNGIRDYYRRSGMYSRASAGTFQSGRVSTATFRSTSTLDMADDCSLSPTEGRDSPRLGHARNESDAEYESGADLSAVRTASSTNHRQHTRQPTDSSHIIDLDELNQTSTKRAVNSQDFISWPYSGWKTAAVAAH